MLGELVVKEVADLLNDPEIHWKKPPDVGPVREAKDKISPSGIPYCIKPYVTYHPSRFARATPVSDKLTHNKEIERKRKERQGRVNALQHIGKTLRIFSSPLLPLEIYSDIQVPKNVALSIYPDPEDRLYLSMRFNLPVDFDWEVLKLSNTIFAPFNTLEGGLECINADWDDDLIEDWEGENSDLESFSEVDANNEEVQRSYDEDWPYGDKD